MEGRGGDGCQQEGGGGDASSTLRMVLQHHKNERNYHYAPIQFDLPPSLNLLVARHVLVGHQVLALKGERLLWVDSKGKGMSQSQLTNWFNALQLKHVATFATFPPRSLRHIFVGDRGAHDSVPGPGARGAASVMGNSPAAWRKYYDLHITAREVQQAVGEMEHWRQATLAGEAQHAEGVEVDPLVDPLVEGPSTEQVQGQAKRRRVLLSSSSDSEGGLLGEGEGEGEDEFFDCL